MPDVFFAAASFTTDFARCGACASLVQPQRPTAEALQSAYKGYHTHDEELDDDAAPGMKRWMRRAYIARRFGGSSELTVALGSLLYRLVSSNRAETDARYRFVSPPPGEVLDYGCGSGGFLLRLQALGHRVAGVDFDRRVVTRLEQLGLRVCMPEILPEEAWQARFDHITLGHVLEHLPEPRLVLRQLARFLKPSGRIFIETPNAAATGQQIFGRYWRGLEAPRHLAIPTRRGLHSALDFAGLVIKREYLRKSVRPWMWEASLEAAPEAEREGMRAAMRRAPAQMLDNAEFLTLEATLA